MMSIAAPFLVFLLIGAFAAYHRLRLAVWAAITAAGLVACWLLGANGTATIVAGLIAAVIAVPLLVGVWSDRARRPLHAFNVRLQERSAVSRAFHRYEDGSMRHRFQLRRGIDAGPVD